MKVSVVRCRWRSDERILVEIRVPLVKDVLLQVVVFGMGCAEAHRQAKGLVASVRPDEFHRVITVDRREMLDFPVVGLAVVRIAGRTRYATPIKVEEPLGCPRIDFHPELTHEPRAIARRAQQRRVAPIQPLQVHRRHGERVAMLPTEFPSQDACPGRGADRRGAKRVGEANPPCCQPIDIGSLDDLVSHATQQVPAMVVGHQENNVWRPLGGLATRARS